MTPFAAPVRDLRFVLEELLEHGSLSLPGFEEASPDLVEAVLEEAARLAGEVWAPLNASGDRQGCQLKDGKVQLPDGFIKAYQAYAEGGWNGIGVAEALGGQGLPEVEVAEPLVGPPPADESHVAYFDESEVSAEETLGQAELPGIEPLPGRG